MLDTSSTACNYSAAQTEVRGLRVKTNSLASLERLAPHAVAVIAYPCNSSLLSDNYKIAKVKLLDVQVNPVQQFPVAP